MIVSETIDIYKVNNSIGTALVFVAIPIIFIIYWLIIIYIKKQK